jgi:hypothetical protein
MSKSRGRWKPFIVAAGSVTAFAGGLQLGDAPAAPVASAPVHAREDGNNGMFSVDVTPRGDSSDVDILIVNEHAKRAWASLAVEVVDDRGVAVMPARKLRPFAVDGRAAAPELEHALPRALADGYYQVRVTTALSDGDTTQTKTITEHLHVRDGARRWISSSDFYSASNAVMATSIVEVRK